MRGYRKSEEEVRGSKSCTHDRKPPNRVFFFCLVEPLLVTDVPFSYSELVTRYFEVRYLVYYQFGAALPKKLDLGVFSPACMKSGSG